MELTNIHYLSLFLVLLISLAPSWYVGRKIKSAEDYSVGGHKASYAIVVGALMGSALGGASTVGTAQLAFDYGIRAWWFTLSEGLALIFMGAFYASPLRKAGLTTISEFMVKTFGRFSGPLTSVTATLGIFFSIVSSSLTALHVFSNIFHLDIIATMLLILLIVAAMVFFGGLGGSGLTGIIKVGIIFVTLSVSGVLTFIGLGQWSGITSTFPANPWLNLFSSGLENTFYSCFSVIVGMVSTQTYVQAVYSAKDSRTAVASCFAAAAVIIPVGLPAVLIGMFMKVQHPELAAIQAMPYFFVNYLPPWLGGAALTGIIISAIGSVAGLALGCGTMISRDIFSKLFGITSTQKLMWINRFAVLAITALALVFDLYNLNSYVLKWNYMSLALRAAGIFLPMTFAIYFKGKLSKAWGLAAMVAGIFVALTWTTIIPSASHSLFQSLLANLIFLIPAVVLF